MNKKRNKSKLISCNFTCKICKSEIVEAKMYYTLTLQIVVGSHKIIPVPQVLEPLLCELCAGLIRDN